jgi:hypothetical protein
MPTVFALRSNGCLVSAEDKFHRYLFVCSSIHLIEALAVEKAIISCQASQIFQGSNQQFSSPKGGFYATSGRGPQATSLDSILLGEKRNLSLFLRRLARRRDHSMQGEFNRKP